MQHNSTHTLLKDIPTRLLIYILMCGAATLLSCRKEGEGDGRKGVVRFERTTDVDSAYHVFKDSGHGDLIAHANHLFHLMDMSQTTDSLIQYSSDADKGRVTAYADYWMAEYLYQTQRPKEAMTVGQMALREAQGLNDAKLQADINSLLAAAYSRLGMFEEGLRCLDFCYKESKRTGDAESMSSDLNNMAAMFISLKQYDKARQHIDKALEIERRLQTRAPEQAESRAATLAVRLGIASETHMLLGRLDEAEAFAREAYDIDLRGGREGKAAIRLSQLASVLQKKGSTAEARAALDKALPTLKENGITYSAIICENQLGDIFLQEGKRTEAERHYQNALRMSDSKEFRYMKQRALNGLWKTLRGTDTARAAQYLEQYAALADSLHNEATEKQLANMQAQFEYNELQAENERLQYRHDIHTLLWIAGIIACLLVITTLSYILYAKNKRSVIERQTDVTINLIEKENGQEAAKTDNEQETAKPGDGQQTAKPNDEKAVAKPDDSKKQEKQSARSESDAEFINQFVTFVNRQITSRQTVDAASCASHLCVSPRHFSRKVTAITGFTPSAYINRIKINRAKRLLDTSPQLSITEVCAMSGFEDLAYFGKLFRQAEGLSPTKYKARREFL